MFVGLKAAIAALAVAGWAGGASAAMEAVFPPLDKPNFLFGDGSAAAGKPTFYPRSASTGGAPSRWSLLQWRQKEYLRPEEKNGNLDGGSVSWSTPSGALELRVRKEGSAYSYELRQRGGVSESSGATDLFLAATPSVSNLTLARKVVLSLAAKISYAEITYFDKRASLSGAVLAQLGANFRMRYIEPTTGKSLSVMIGAPIATSRDRPPAHLGCHYFGSKRAPQIVSVQSLPGESLLPFVAGTAQHLTFDVNKLVCAAVARSFPCRDDDGGTSLFAWPEQASNPENWTIDGMTVGVETQDHFQKGGDKAEGVVGAGLIISDLKVLRSADGAAPACMKPNTVR